MDPGQVARPVQERIPIWVVGVWPRPTSMRRVLRCDGIIPQYDLGGREHKPSDARAAKDWLIEHGAGAWMDVISEGETPADDHAAAVAVVTPWAEAGCTWWLETRWEMPHDAGDRMLQVRERLIAGPPVRSSPGTMGGLSSVVDEDVDNPVEKQPMPGITLSFLWTAVDSQKILRILAANSCAGQPASSRNGSPETVTSRGKPRNAGRAGKPVFSGWSPALVAGRMVHRGRATGGFAP